MNHALNFFYIDYIGMFFTYFDWLNQNPALTSNRSPQVYRNRLEGSTIEKKAGNRHLSSQKHELKIVLAPNKHVSHLFRSAGSE